MVRGLIGGALQILIIAACLLVPADTWRWPRALQFLVVYGIVNVAAIVALARLAPASLEARLAAPVSKSQPMADRIITPLLVASILGWFAFVPVDVFRLQLLPPPVPAVSVLGALVAATGYGVIWGTLLQNSFAAPIVMDQSERGQALIDTGLYSRIRHPFYLGFALFLMGLGLWLGSHTSMLALLVPLVFLVARILVEEKTLRETLPGYADYMTRVRYRLIPYVW